MLGWVSCWCSVFSIGTEDKMIGFVYGGCLELMGVIGVWSLFLEVEVFGSGFMF